ncbi:hypothetical protein [Ruminococcus albus]|uniref:Fibronectin type III domain protein n=1 Tax=Ruminococcus albus TaxID=1264 RepID=A0A1H7QJJ0_RUMAL|nr:hypothetical protein [Ruminococcus albus]SEL47949.1 hypothetical protein SAMN05216469_1422 [Ruminococcus albus]
MFPHCARRKGIGDFYGTVTKTFCIKERPVYNIPDDVNAPFGSTLANVKLPAADNGTWSWEDSSLNVGNVGTKNFKAIFTPKDTEHYLTIKGISVPVTVHHTYIKVVAVEPTCTKKGNIEYYICSDGKYYTDDKGTKEITLSATVVKAKGHSFVEPTWNWSKDYSRATISSTCAECGKVSSTNALIRTETIDPTYTSEGKTIYKATVTFNNKTYNDTKEVTIPKLVYTAPEISYEQGYNAVKLSWDKVGGAEKYGIAGYVNGKWKLLDTCTDNTYELRNHKEGKKYKVAVVTMLSGNWVQDVSNAVIVAPKDTETRFPSITSIAYNEEYHQFKLNWTKVKGAQNYGLAVFTSGKWVVVKQDIPIGTTSFTSPKLRPGQTYKMVICAKVGGKWDTVDISSRAFSVTVK